MADHTLTPSTRDVRASDIEFKRAKDASNKWKHGSKPLQNSETGKVRPGKGVRRTPHPRTNNTKGVEKFNMTCCFPSTAHNSRLAASHFAKLEARDHTLPLDLPHSSPFSHNSSIDECQDPTIAPDLWPKEVGDVLYSFDAEASPASSLGLDSLVDKAEGAWRAKEVERILKTEYDVVDSDGDSLRVGKGGKLSTSFTLPRKGYEVEEDVDGDWETVSV